jgi:hypothetical protein
MVPMRSSETPPGEIDGMKRLAATGVVAEAPQ